MILRDRILQLEYRKTFIQIFCKKWTDLRDKISQDKKFLSCLDQKEREFLTDSLNFNIMTYSALLEVVDVNLIENVLKLISSFDEEAFKSYYDRIKANHDNIFQGLQSIFVNFVNKHKGKNIDYDDKVLSIVDKEALQQLQKIKQSIQRKKKEIVEDNITIILEAGEFLKNSECQPLTLEYLTPESLTPESLTPESLCSKSFLPKEIICKIYSKIIDLNKQIEELLQKNKLEEVNKTKKQLQGWEDLLILEIEKIKQVLSVKEKSTELINALNRVQLLLKAAQAIEKDQEKEYKKIVNDMKAYRNNNVCIFNLDEKNSAMSNVDDDLKTILKQVTIRTKKIKILENLIQCSIEKQYKKSTTIIEQKCKNMTTKELSTYLLNLLIPVDDIEKFITSRGEKYFFLGFLSCFFKKFTKTFVLEAKKSHFKTSELIEQKFSQYKEQISELVSIICFQETSYANHCIVSLIQRLPSISKRNLDDLDLSKAEELKNQKGSLTKVILSKLKSKNDHSDEIKNLIEYLENLYKKKNKKRIQDEFGICTKTCASLIVEPWDVMKWSFNNPEKELHPLLDIDNLKEYQGNELYRKICKKIQGKKKEISEQELQKKKEIYKNLQILLSKINNNGEQEIGTIDLNSLDENYYKSEWESLMEEVENYIKNSNYKMDKDQFLDIDYLQEENCSIIKCFNILENLNQKDIDYAPGGYKQCLDRLHKRLDHLKLHMSYIIRLYKENFEKFYSILSNVEEYPYLDESCFLGEVELINKLILADKLYRKVEVKLNDLSHKSNPSCKNFSTDSSEEKVDTSMQNKMQEIYKNLQILLSKINNNGEQEIGTIDLNSLDENHYKSERKSLMEEVENYIKNSDYEMDKDQFLDINYLQERTEHLVKYIDGLKSLNQQGQLNQQHKLKCLYAANKELNYLELRLSYIMRFYKEDFEVLSYTLSNIGNINYFYDDSWRQKAVCQKAELIDELIMLNKLYPDLKDKLNQMTHKAEESNDKFLIESSGALDVDSDYGSAELPSCESFSIESSGAHEVDSGYGSSLTNR